MEGNVIREANDGDVQSIAYINSTVWQMVYKGTIDDDFLEKRTVENRINFFKNAVKNENVYIFEENNIIKGFVNGKTTSDKYDCEIIGLYVMLEYQGKNIGTKLLDHMKLYYRDRGCKNMIIWTIKNLRNNDFYKKHGGIIKEERELEFGNRKYPGIGFVFELK
jgi:GNAT superfamily N-acetyltransferase